MRLLQTLVLLFALLAFAPCFAAEEGKPAPLLTAKLFSGENFSLAAVSGQVVIVHFWATWCVPCQTEMPIFEAYYKAHHAEGLQYLAVSMDKPEDEKKARERMKDFSFSAAMAKDVVYKGYGRIWRLPLTFVIDRKGILRKDGWDMDHTMTAEDLEKTITPLLAK